VEQKYKGQYKIINDEQIEIDSDTIKISEIDKLAVRSLSSRAIGTGLLMLSTGNAAVGAVVLVIGVNSNNYAGILIGVIIGVSLIAVGIIIDIASVPFFFIKKKYEIDNDWDINILPEHSVK